MPTPLSPRSRTRALPILIALLLVVAAVTSATAVDLALSPTVGPERYNLNAWEVRHVADKWLYLLGSRFRPHPSVANEDAAIARFLALDAEIDTLEQRTSDAAQRGQPADPARAAQIAADQHERDTLRLRVEAAIEGRITAVLQAAGVTRSLPLLGDTVWPPVDFEFTESPRSLALSPRDHIAVAGTELLREDLSLADVERIETEKQTRDNLSALAFETEGIGAYPTLVAYETDYRSLLEVAGHEWTHNYLFFRPLGFDYARNYDVQSMNETVADLVGHEIADAVIARWPLVTPAPASPTPAPTAPAPTARPPVDVAAALRQLRGDVDTLLAAGQIDGAEALMEQRREDLAAQSVYFRKINQAFFAFTNLYAGENGDPAATNPIGPKIDQLRQRSGSLAAFLRVMGNVTNVAQLDEALAQAQP